MPRSSPGPVRHTTELGSNRASLCTDAQIASIRSRGSAGPSISGSGKIDGTAGDRSRPTEPARLELLVRLVVATFRKLDLPDADSVDSRGGVGAEVRLERRTQRRDL